jgi:hypothetical protein
VVQNEVSGIMADIVSMCKKIDGVNGKDAQSAGISGKALFILIKTFLLHKDTMT